MRISDWSSDVCSSDLLGRQREVADLIQEQCSAIGALETAGPRFVGAGIGAAPHAEEFGFHQIQRDRRAIDRDERAAPARSLLVQPSGKDLLADAGFSQQEKIDRTLRSFPKPGKCLEKRRGRANNCSGFQGWRWIPLLPGLTPQQK